MMSALSDMTDVGFVGQLAKPPFADEFGSEQPRFEENPWRHDNLENCVSADAVADVEHAIVELNARGIGNVENGVQIPRCHTSASTNATPKHNRGADKITNGSLTDDGFALTAPCGRANGRSLLSASIKGSAPTFSPMEN